MGYVGSFSQLGIGSGIDFNSLLDQLQKAENQRLVPYVKKQDSCKSQISAWGDIKSALNDLQTSAKALSGTAFNTFTSNETKTFKATSNSNAMAGVNSVSVQSLASASSIATKASQDSNSELIGAGGTITISLGGDSSRDITVNLEDDQTSLEQVAKQINKQNGDVTAVVTRDNDAQDGGYHLQLISKKTGTANEITSIKVSNNDQLGKVLDYTAGDQSGNMSSIVDAQDAVVVVNGRKYTRSSNNIDDIIPGVTLSLNSVSSKDSNGNFGSEQLILTQDTKAIKDAVKDFVDKYNALNKKINESKTTGGDSDDDSTKTASDNTDDPFDKESGGPLASDSTLRDLTSQILNDVASAYVGLGNPDISSLSNIGIEIDAKTSEMRLNQSKFDDALEKNGDQIQKMFVGNDKLPGLAVALKETTTDYLGDSDKNIKGIIEDTTKGLNDELSRLKKQIAQTQELIDSQMETYTKQFQNLDSIMSQMKSTSSALISSLG